MLPMLTQELALLGSGLSRWGAAIGTTGFQRAKPTKGDGTGTLTVTNGQPREIWARRSDTRELFTMILPPNPWIPLVDGDPSIEDITMRVARPPGIDRYVFIDCLDLDGRESIGDLSPMELMIFKALYTVAENIATLRALPSDPTALSLKVAGLYFYRKPSTRAWQSFATTSMTAEISTAVGALGSGQHQLSLVYLDKETGALGLALSAASTAIGPLPARSNFVEASATALLDTLADAQQPVSAVYLYKNQTTVEEADFYRDWPLRDVFDDSPRVGTKDLIDRNLTVGANHQYIVAEQVTITATLTVIGTLVVF